MPFWCEYDQWFGYYFGIYARGYSKDQVKRPINVMNISMVLSNCNVVIVRLSSLDTSGRMQSTKKCKSHTR